MWNAVVTGGPFRSGRGLHALCLAVLAFAAVVAPRSLTALEEFTNPNSMVILTVKGKVGRTNVGDEAVFDRDMLSLFPQHEIRTASPWTEGEVAFRGPRLIDVLKFVEADGDRLVAKALNDYSVEIPVEDAKSFGVILAMSQDGKPLTLRRKGPLWVVYPWSDNEELQHSRYYNRSIWHLRELTVE